MLRAAVGIVALGLMAPQGGAAQNLADRIDGAGNTSVTFRFDVDDDVMICRNGIRMGSEDSQYYWGNRRGQRDECTDGPMEVRVALRGGDVMDLDVGPPGQHTAEVDLGHFAAQEAAEFLANVPWMGADDDAVGRAYMAVRFARDVEVSASVARAVRDRDLPEDVRRSVVFWAGQLAADNLLEALHGLVLDESEDQNVRDQAIFALSQRPDRESSPLLLELARDAPHLKSRRTALFWLAQHDTEEVGEFFAQIILGEGRGG